MLLLLHRLHVLHVAESPEGPGSRFVVCWNQRVECQLAFDGSRSRKPDPLGIDAIGRSNTSRLSKQFVAGAGA